MATAHTLAPIICKCTLDAVQFKAYKHLSGTNTNCLAWPTSEPGCWGRLARSRLILQPGNDQLCGQLPSSFANAVTWAGATAELQSCKLHQQNTRRMHAQTAVVPSLGLFHEPTAVMTLRMWLRTCGAAPCSSGTSIWLVTRSRCRERDCAAQPTSIPLACFFLHGFHYLYARCLPSACSIAGAKILTPKRCQMPQILGEKLGTTLMQLMHGCPQVAHRPQGRPCWPGAGPSPTLHRWP